MIKSLKERPHKITPVKGGEKNTALKLGTLLFMLLGIQSTANADIFIRDIFVNGKTEVVAHVTGLDRYLIKGISVCYRGSDNLFHTVAGDNVPAVVGETNVYNILFERGLENKGLQLVPTRTIRGAYARNGNESSVIETLLTDNTGAFETIPEESERRVIVNGRKTDQYLLKAKDQDIIYTKLRGVTGPYKQKVWTTTDNKSERTEVIIDPSEVERIKQETRKEQVRQENERAQQLKDALLEQERLKKIEEDRKRQAELDKKRREQEEKDRLERERLKRIEDELKRQQKEKQDLENEFMTDIYSPRRAELDRNTLPAISAIFDEAGIEPNEVPTINSNILWLEKNNFHDKISRFLEKNKALLDKYPNLAEKLKELQTTRLERKEQIEDAAREFNLKKKNSKLVNITVLVNGGIQTIDNSSYFSRDLEGIILLKKGILPGSKNTALDLKFNKVSDNNRIQYQDMAVKLSSGYSIRFDNDFIRSLSLRLGAMYCKNINTLNENGKPFNYDFENFDLTAEACLYYKYGSLMLRANPGLFPSKNKSRTSDFEQTARMQTYEAILTTMFNKNIEVALGARYGSIINSKVDLTVTIILNPFYLGYEHIIENEKPVGNNIFAGIQLKF